MRYFKWLPILILAVLIGCATTTPTPVPVVPPSVETPYIDASFSFKVRTMHVNYNLAKQKKIDKERCYIVIEITDIPEGENAWTNADVRPGDFIVMYENSPGNLSVLHCSNDLETVKGWFIGKVRAELKTANGYMLERLRFTGPNDEFETKVVHIIRDRE